MIRTFRFTQMTLLAALAVAIFSLPVAALGQAANQTTTVKGHANNEINQALAGMDVKLSTDGGATFKFKTSTNATGDYTIDVPPGTYVMVLADPKNPDPKKIIDEFTDVKVGATPVTQDFDDSRPDYMAKLSPERKKQIEDIKKANAGALAANSQIKNLNAALAQARADIAAKNYQPAIDSMTQASTAKPDEPVLVYTLGIAQLGAGKNDDAVVSFKKALELAQTAKKPQPEITGAAYNDLARAQAAAGKTDDAVASFESAMKADPQHAEMYGRNEAVTLTKANKPEEAAAAADKVIAINPQNAEAYYLKAAALVQKASVDKAGKIVLPPGCGEAYQKYLELAPTGPHAEEVKQVLASAGETIHSSYKAGKKS